jgi:hypothetical protein
MLKCRLTHRCHWLGPFVFDPLHHARPYRPLSRTPRPPSAARQPAKAEVSGVKMTLRDSGPERPKSARGTMSSNPVSSSGESGENRDPVVPAGLSIEATAAPSSVDHCFITLVNVFVFDWVDAQVPVCMQVLCCSWQLERHWPAFWADSQPESQRLLRKLHVYFDGSAGCCAQAAPAARTNTTAAQSDRRICLSSTKSQPPDLRERRFHGGAGVPPTGTITPIA